MKIYITHLLQILNFSSPFRRFEMKNSLRRPTIVADNISNLVAPLQNSFHFYGPVQDGITVHLSKVVEGSTSLLRTCKSNLYYCL